MNLSFETLQDGILFHLTLLMNAIKKVDKKYLWYQNDIAEVNVKKEIIEHLERVFTYELYHQWSLLLSAFDSELIINAEINKKCFIKEEQQPDLPKAEVKTFFPDFVLHKGHESTDNQLLVCEVKRRVKLNYEKIEDDIDSLVIYMNPEKFTYNYKYGVFILVGCDKEYLADKLKKTSKKWDEYSNRIFCITYNYHDKTEEYSYSIDCLHDLLFYENVNK